MRKENLIIFLIFLIIAALVTAAVYVSKKVKELNEANKNLFIGKGIKL